MNELAGTAQASHGTGRNTIDGAGLSRIAEGCRGPALGSWRRQERPSCAERALAQSAVGLRAALHSMPGRVTFTRRVFLERRSSTNAHQPIAPPAGFRSCSPSCCSSNTYCERERGQQGRAPINQLHEFDVPVARANAAPYHTRLECHLILSSGVRPCAMYQVRLHGGLGDELVDPGRALPSFLKSARRSMPGTDRGRDRRLPSAGGK